jgi:hypothetical protein
MEINQIDLKKYMICDAPKRIDINDLQTLVAPCGKRKQIREYLFCERENGDKCEYRNEKSEFQIQRKPYRILSDMWKESREL